MSGTKIILLCGSRFALPVMRDLFFHGKLAAVVVPDHCAGFRMEIEPLLAGAIPILEVTKENYETKLQALFQEKMPAIGLIMGFSYRIPVEVFNLPASGFFNVHPGPLPSYRGPDPVFRQIKNREEYASVAIHKLANKLDSGEIVLQDKIRLSVTDTHGILTNKLAELASKMVDSLIKIAEFGMKIPCRPQDESKARYYKRQNEQDVIVEWEKMDALCIVALINACNPWNKGAVTKCNETIIRLLDAEPVLDKRDNPHIPGTILNIDETGMLVATIHDQAILVKVISCDAGIFMPGRLAGTGLFAGQAFN